jgi:hypothetical protein
MKKIQTIASWAVCACFFILFNAACNDKLDLIEGNKEVPVVYGFLSLNDTATYIRVERSFIDAIKPAAEVAKIADSLYYKNMSVTLVRVANNEKFVLTRVDGNTEGYKRDTGFFAQSPNYLYKAKNATLSMRADEQWRIVLQRISDTKILAQATTKVVGDYNIFAPQTGATLFLTYDNTFNVSVETVELTAKFYDVKIIVNYDELIGTTRTPKKAEWLLTQGTPRIGVTQQIFFRRNAKEFYTFLSTNIPVNGSATRFFKDFDIEVTAGGQELIDFQNVGIANIGITGSQSIPNYTNIENGLGIFTSRNKTVLRGVKLNDQSLDLLKTGEVTKSLNFR